MAKEKGILKGMPSTGCHRSTTPLRKKGKKRQKLGLEDSEEAAGKISEADFEEAEQELEARGFTSKALADFVNDAWKKAAHIHGSDLGDVPSDSQEKAKENSIAFDGSIEAEGRGSQAFHQEIRHLVQRHFQE